MSVAKDMHELLEAISVRASKYRGQEGFSVTGKPAGSTFPISIFVKSRETAIAIRDRIKEGGNWDDDVDTLIRNEGSELSGSPLLEKKGKKSPKEALGSLQRWLKGANPAVKSYSATLEAAAKKNPHPMDEAAIALIETANLLREILDRVQKLNETVPEALKGF